MIKLKELFEATNTFGMKGAEYDSLLKASDRKGYKPTPDKIKGIMKLYPKISKDEAMIALRLYNSPARNTFTVHDLMSYLNKKYK